jgi:hypothetical protein
VIPQTPFERSAGIVVLNAVANEDLQLPIVANDRNFDAQLPIGRQQERSQRVVELQTFGRFGDVPVDRFERVHGGSLCMKEERIDRWLLVIDHLKSIFGLILFSMINDQRPITNDQFRPSADFRHR